MVVLASAIIAYIVTEVYGQKNALILTGDVPVGLPTWQLPWRFNLNSTSSNSSLPNPLEIAEDLGIGIFMLPFVSVLQHLAIAKFYTRKLCSSFKWKCKIKYNFI